ncbi:MAG: TauD/TfdA family dioxygenase, partial [Pseudohongiellaceae bacterium]
ATTPVLPAIRQLPDGRRVFFNQLIAAFKGWQDARNQANKSVCFGDGSALADEDMETVCAISEELAFDLPWVAGDIALVDNFLVMHGRRPFEGQRCVLASLLA